MAAASVSTRMRQTRMRMARVALLVLVLLPRRAQSFSSPGLLPGSRHNDGGGCRSLVPLPMGTSGGAAATSNLVSSDSGNTDRFRSVCLVGKESEEAVDEFDPALLRSLDENGSGSNDDLWVAVYRSNNNKPSVVVRDDFFRAMNDATSGGSNNTGESGSDSDDPAATVSTVSGAASFLSDTMPSLLEVPSTKPVAIARLRKADESDGNAYLLDNLRCALKKEDQDASRDGGSEFVEALGVAVDTLVLKHLRRLLRDDDDDSGEEPRTPVVFEGTVRTKATLFSGKLFEERGFSEVEALSRDMATHVSSYSSCLETYAGRSIGAGMAPGTRDRALQIVALLGRLDPEAQVAGGSAGGGGDDDEYDPWANMQLYRS